MRGCSAAKRGATRFRSGGSGAAAKPDAAVLPVVRDQGAAGEQPGDQADGGAAANRQLGDAGARQGDAGEAVMEPLAADPDAPLRRVVAEKPVAVGPGTFHRQPHSSD